VQEEKVKVWGVRRCFCLWGFFVGRGGGGGGGGYGV